MARWQWYVLGAIVLFSGYHITKGYWENHRLNQHSVVVTATITNCVFVRSSGLILEYSFVANGRSFSDRGAANGLNKLCSEEQCCTGAHIAVEYLAEDPSINRIKYPARLLSGSADH